MPLIKVNSSVDCPLETKQATTLALSKICATVIGKPETYVQAFFCGTPDVFSHGGQLADAAFVEVMSIGGLGPQVNKKLSAGICSCLQDMLKLDGSKIYIRFSDAVGSNWGWNGSTF